MSLSFKFIPLTFLNDENEIKKQIRNTIILKYFFEINSEIVHLEDLITGTQYGYNASALVQGRNKFLRISDITDGKVDWKTVPYCNCTDEETYLLFPNDILIARTGGTTGKSFLISEPPALSIYAGYLIRIRANEETDPNYLNLFLNSYVYWSQIVSLNEDNFRPSVNANKLKKLILPKCDETAQNDAVKISNGELVNGYDDLYQLIEETLLKYDKLKEIQFEKNNQLELQKALKQSILSEAIQGKLTEKWREKNLSVEEASIFLECIKNEKNQLIKEKKLKKEKDLPPITKEEIPFELPKSWAWCRLGEICNTITKGSSPNWQGVQYVDSPEKGILFITSKNVDSFKVDLTKVTYVEEKFNEIEPRSILKKGDLLTNIVGASIGRTALYELDEIANINQAVCILRIENHLINKQFLLLLMNSNFIIELMFRMQFSPGRANLSMGDVSNFTIPFPPCQEQEEIVAKLEELMIFYKELEIEILESEKLANNLMQAVLKEAFEVKELI